MSFVSGFLKWCSDGGSEQMKDNLFVSFIRGSFRFEERIGDQDQWRQHVDGLVPLIVSPCRSVCTVTIYPSLATTMMMMIGMTAIIWPWCRLGSH